MPTPFFGYDEDTGDLYRTFPTNSSDQPNGYGTCCKYISESTFSSRDLTISYKDGNLIINNGKETPLFSIPASPYILIDIQAPGGTGGTGSHAYNKYGVMHYHALSSGAGGYSGNFVSLSVFLDSELKLSIHKGDYISGRTNDAAYSIRTSNMAEDTYLTVYGKHGKGGSYSGSNSSL